MKIGNLDLGNSLLVAPMADITNGPFRMMMKKFGAGLTFTPMFSADGVAKGNFETLRMLSYARSEKPIGVQLLGNDPKIIKTAIKEIIKRKPDLIDINCGCPVSKVVNNKMGSCLLIMPQTLGEIVKAMKEASPNVPTTVKLRLGFDDNKINVLENAKIAEDNGASAIIIHARTKTARYLDPVDYSWVKKVKQNVSIPVIGNGSLFTPRDILKMLNETNCDSALIARGAIGNPFLFDRFNKLVETGIDPGEPEINVVKDVAIEHLKLIIREFGEIGGLDKAKKNIIWYFMFRNGIDELMNKVFPIKSASLLEEVIAEHTHNIELNKFAPLDRNIIQKKFEEKILFWLTKKST